jgi:hypothetical protein
MTVLFEFCCWTFSKFCSNWNILLLQSADVLDLLSINGLLAQQKERKFYFK